MCFMKISEDFPSGGMLLVLGVRPRELRFFMQENLFEDFSLRARLRGRVRSHLRVHPPVGVRFVPANAQI